MDQVVAIGDGANDLVRLLLHASPTACAHSHTHTHTRARAHTTHTQRYAHTGVYTRARTRGRLVHLYIPILPNLRVREPFLPAISITYPQPATYHISSTTHPIPPIPSHPCVVQDMLHAVGLGIAFNAKPRVQEEAQFTINQQVREEKRRSRHTPVVRCVLLCITVCYCVSLCVTAWCTCSPPRTLFPSSNSKLHVPDYSSSPFPSPIISRSLVLAFSRSLLRSFLFLSALTPSSTSSGSGPPTLTRPRSVSRSTPSTSAAQTAPPRVTLAAR